ncbi:outer membrane beta-barrel protein [Ahrensia marina]|uniref:outer membrane beta-barrel protein n=1 Tax=Ahrensia marina TaxID=1514904 RepID=UPI0035D02A9F
MSVRSSSLIVFGAFASLTIVPLGLMGVEPAQAQSQGEVDAGDRYATVSQSGGDPDLTGQASAGQQVVGADDLVRFSLPDTDLVTGAVDTPPTPELATQQGIDVPDPYAPIGIRSGPLTWFPAIDLAVGYDSNTDSEVDARQVRTLTLSPEISVESDWSRHAWTGSLRGSLEYVDDGRDLGRSLAIDNELRLDLGLETTVTLRGGYTLTGEPDSDDNAAAGADGSTDTHEFEVGATVARTIGPVEASLGVDASRSLFSDTNLAGGGVQSNEDRNRFDGDLTMRLSQAPGPIMRPFVEGTIGLRRFDERVDRNGFERNSLGYGLRGGLTIADDGPLSGEASIGFAGEQFADDQLEDVLTLTAAASLTWDVTALTSVTLDVETELDPTTRAGSGVGINRSAELGLTHALRRNVDLRLGVGVDDTVFSGIDAETRTYSGRAGLTWRASPIVAFRLDTTYEHEPDDDGDINRFTAQAGVTLRR